MGTPPWQFNQVARPSLKQVTLGVKDYNKLLAAIHDRASVNGSALATVVFLFPQLCSLPCVSHIVNDGGETMEYPELDELWFHWLAAISRSDVFNADYRDQFEVNGYVPVIQHNGMHDTAVMCNMDMAFACHRACLTAVLTPCCRKHRRNHAKHGGGVNGRHRCTHS